MSIDHRKLLVAALAQVMQNEGVCFIGDNYGYPENFTEEDKIEIEKCIEEASQ